MSDSMIGRAIGNYKIEEELGQGGMGSVYKAVHNEIGNFVAVKVLGIGKDIDDRERARYLSEAKALAALRHTNIVGVLDFIQDEGIYFTLMEYVEGKNLQVLIREHNGPLPENLVGKIVGQIARALDYAHNRGIIHRDIKPANIMIADDDRVVLTDFGIAKLAESTTLDITRDGAAIGTPTYMSPEQASGKSVDGRSDIYSLGVVLFQMLTGQVPFAGATAIETIGQHVTKEPPSPREINPNISRKQERIILKALEKDMKDRYQRAGDLANDLLTTISASGEIMLETGSQWERFVEGQTWGRLMQTSRLFNRIMKGGGRFVSRSFIGMILGVLLVGYALLIGIAWMLGNSIQSTITEYDWPFDRVGIGHEISYKPEELARSLESGANRILSGTLSNFIIEIPENNQFKLLADFGDSQISFDFSVRILDGFPVFSVQRLNDIPLPVISNMLARGINQGFEEILIDKSAKISEISSSEEEILVVVDGSGAGTEALIGKNCRPYESLTDDFTDIYSGWAQTYTSSQADVGYNEGGYVINTKFSNIIINQALPCNFTIFDAIVESTPLSDPGDASWGLAFLETNPDNYWVFQINNLQWYSVEQVIDGQHNMLISWAQSSAINSNEQNILRVLITETEGEVFVNGESMGVFEIPEDSIPVGGGSFGLLVRSGQQATADILFDNINVKLPE